MKINRGSGFVGVLDYILDPATEPQLVDLDNVHVRHHFSAIPNTVDLGNEMQVSAGLNRKVEKPVWHAQIAFAPDDEPRLSEDLYKNIIRDVKRELGVEAHQLIAVVHNDTAHKHIHLVVNRVNKFTKECREVNQGMDKVFMMKLSKRLEDKYKLTKAVAASRTYTTSDIRKNTYSHRPNKQVLNNVLQSVYRDIQRREFSSESDLKKHLGELNMEIVTMKGEKTKRSYKGIAYTFRFFNNKSKQIEEDTYTVKFSRLAKKMSYSKLIAEMKSNYSHEADKVDEMHARMSKTLDKLSIGSIPLRDVYSILAFQGIDLQKSYAGKAVERLTDKEQRLVLSELVANKNQYRVPGLQLKQALYEKQEFAHLLQPGIQFSFNKHETDLIGRETIKSFYASYLKEFAPKMEYSNLFLNIIANKAPNHHTVNFIIAQATGNSLGYNHRLVHSETATIAFNTLGRKDLTKSNALQQIEDAERITNAVRAFKSSDSYSQKDIIKFMARRGAEFIERNGSVHITLNNEDLGLATAYGLEMFRKYNEDKISFSNDDFKKIYKKESKKRSNQYTALDKMDLKGISNRVKEGQQFSLDEFDLRAYKGTFGENINKLLKHSTIRRFK